MTAWNEMTGPQQFTAMHEMTAPDSLCPRQLPTGWAIYRPARGRSRLFVVEPVQGGYTAHIMRIARNGDLRSEGYQGCLGSFSDGLGAAAAKLPGVIDAYRASAA